MSDGPRAVQFGIIEGGSVDVNPSGIELLRDVTLVVHAELGKTKRLVRDILRLQIGGVLELDKEAGEPVDILVNNKRIARGEVVEIDGRYGVRITEITK